MSVLGSLVKKTIDLPKEYLELHKLALDAMTENQELLAKLGLLRDERDALKEEVKALKEKADRQKELVRAEGVYFRLTPDKRGLEEAPYCQSCSDNDSKLYRMVEDGGLYECPECYRANRHSPFDAGVVRRIRAELMSKLQEAAEGR
jgi:hypothetical protein